MNIFLSLVALVGACVLANALRNTAMEKDQPPFWEKAETARWLAHENEWGTLSTSSVHLKGQAWGQPKSFVDGTATNSTGILYFYDSDMDASMQDINANPVVAFSLHSWVAVQWIKLIRKIPAVREWCSAASLPW